MADIQRDKDLVLTGASGFLGPFLLQEFLDQGYRIRALVRDANSPALLPFRERIGVLVGDITRPETLAEAFSGARYVVHAAGLISFARKDRWALLSVNREGTAQVVNAALEAGVRKLAYVSSVAAIGRPAVAEVPIHEELGWQRSPYNTGYGYSKHLGEREVIRGVEEGLPAVIANPSLIVGQGPWEQGTGQLFRRVYRGLPYYPTGSSGFTGGRDVARAIGVLLKSDFGAGERFIVCTESLSFRVFLAQVAAALGKQAPKRPLPAGLARRMGWIAEQLAAITGAAPLLTEETARTSAHASHFDNRKLCQALDFRYTPLSEVIHETAEAFLRTQ